MFLLASCQKPTPPTAVKPSPTETPQMVDFAYTDEKLSRLAESLFQTKDWYSDEKISEMYAALEQGGEYTFEIPVHISKPVEGELDGVYALSDLKIYVNDDDTVAMGEAQITVQICTIKDKEEVKAFSDATGSSIESVAMRGQVFGILAQLKIIEVLMQQQYAKDDIQKLSASNTMFENPNIVLGLEHALIQVKPDIETASMIFNYFYYMRIIDRDISGSPIFVQCEDGTYCAMVLGQPIKDRGKLYLFHKEMSGKLEKFTNFEDIDELSNAISGYRDLQSK